MLDTSQGVTPQFALGEDQLAVREMARAFAIEVFAPHALDWDEAKHFPVDVMRRGAALGMGGIYVSTRRWRVGAFAARCGADLRGAGRRLPHGCGLHVDPQHGAVDDRSLRHRTRSARNWLPQLCTMELLASYCLTEPGAGSDAAALRNARGARRRSLCAQRPKAVHLRRRCRRPLCRDGAHRRRRRRPGISTLVVRGDTPGISLRRERTQNGLERAANARSDLRGLPRAGRQPARRGGRRLQDRDGRPRRRPAEHRRLFARRRPERRSTRRWPT